MPSSSNPQNAGSLPRPPIHPPFPVSNTQPMPRRLLHALAATAVVVMFGGMFFFVGLYLSAGCRAYEAANARFDLRLDHERGEYVAPTLREVRR